MNRTLFAYRLSLFRRLIDCSFGVFGLVPLLLIRAYIAELKLRQQTGVNY